MFNKKGFTLIEILVAIVIVGILSAFVIIQTNSAINSGKDTKRKADIELLANAVVSYSAEHYSSKPITPTEGCTINGTCPPSINDSLNTYLATLPADPNSGSYYTYQSDGSDCTISASLSNGTTYQYSCDNQQTTTGTPTSGVCGSSNTQGFYTQPTSNFCSDGTIPTVSGTGPWTWSCPGTYLGSDANCTAYLNIDGVCTTGLTYYTTPSSGSCIAGTATSVSGSGPWTWTCLGVNSGVASGTCTANKSIDGVCTTGLTYYTTPSSGSCIAGTASTVSGSGPWYWGCNGINSGTSTSSTACTALKKVDGVCGSAATSYAYSASAYSGTYCSTGNANPATPTFPGPGSSYSWTCTGLNGGTASGTCTASRLNHPCIAAGGTWNGSFCHFNSSACPTGWTQYQNWTATTPGSSHVCGNVCLPWPQPSCCSTGSHTFSNTAVETCGYYYLSPIPGHSCYNAWGTASATVTEVGCYQ